ncbi:MAG TPA: ZIP family metal transporter [Clostridia bacterium]|nr:ZIP family metal transporter [Clostridia bacterium]
MSDLLYSSIIGASAGIIGTGLGGAMAFILDKPGKRFLSILLSLSSGLMLAVVCFDLLPESFEMGSIYSGIIGIICGVAMIIGCEGLINSYISNKRPTYSPNRYIRTGILMGIGIALHNLPEGLAIGSGFIATKEYGWKLALIIALHDIPEGIAMVTPMIIGGSRPYKAFLMAILAGVPTGIGAVFGYMIGSISPIFISISLGFAGGAMLYITANELIPEARELYKGKVSSIGLIAGVIIGILIISAF